MNRLIIDTDPGEDDVMAILMAAAHPNTTIEAITVVAGNVGLDHTVNNVGVVLDVLSADIPFYAGCEYGFVHDIRNATAEHGQDGLGDTGLKSQRKPQPEHAVLELIRRANSAENQLTLVTLGPYTNLATALKLDPLLPHKFKRVVSMAGAATGHGNVTPSAEFNVWADPEAALVVFEAWAACGKQIEIVDWEVTMRNGFTKETRAQWAALNTPKSDFFAQISAHSNRFIEEVRQRTVNYFADPVAMAVALEPDIVTKAANQHVTIELLGETARGRTTVDWRVYGEKAPNAQIVLEMDRERLNELVMLAQR